MVRLRPGLRLGERYILEAPIGTGGMSQVWRAQDEVLARPVAIKTLHGSVRGDPTMRDAVRREARAAARVSHPNVTQIFDYGELATGDGDVLPYLVMELIEGESLAERLQQGPLPPAEAVRVCSEVASALEAAHAHGVVHGDVKPGNVMLTRSGAKVVDFGVAAVAGGGSILRAGTPAYLAPEVLSGGPPTPASDVYALGALMYAALTGAPPIEADSWDEALRALSAPLPTLAVPGQHAGMAELVSRCLSRVPKARPTTADVRAVLTGAKALPASRTVGVAAVRTRTAVMPPTVAEPVPSQSGGVLGGRPPRGGSARDARSGARAVAVAAVVAVLTLVVVAAQALVNQTGVSSLGALSASTAPTPPPTRTTSPAVPMTSGGVLAALETSIRNAVVAGQIDRSLADNLSDDVRDLGRAVARDQERDVVRIARGIQRRLAKEVGEGDLDATVAAQVGRLVDALVRLVGEDDE